MGEGEGSEGCRGEVDGEEGSPGEQGAFEEWGEEAGDEELEGEADESECEGGYEEVERGWGGGPGLGGWVGLGFFESESRCGECECGETEGAAGTDGGEEDVWGDPRHECAAADVGCIGVAEPCWLRVGGG